MTRRPARTQWGLAGRKNELFLAALDERGATAFPGTLDLLRRLRAAGLRTALVTASHNAELVLSSAGIEDLFDTRVDGNDADRLGLPGKPDPALFVEAARRLGADEKRTVVVEDALAGVRAARAGGFGLVVGVNRVGGSAEFTDNGADVVVADVADLLVETTFPGCCLCGDPTSEWVLDDVGFDPAGEGVREARLTLGNGYLATRGAWPEARADGVHYPGVYVAGVYNRLVSEVDGQVREDESVVNLPNWLPFTFRPSGGEWLEPGACEVLHVHRALHLRQGVLTRELVVRDSAGRRTRLLQRTLVSMDAPHRAALETTLTPLNWSGQIEVRSGLDAGVRNTNVAEFAGLADQHLTAVATGVVRPDTVWLTAQTSQAGVLVAQCARTSVHRAGLPVPVSTRVRQAERSVALELELPVARGEDVTVDKSVAVFTSRDVAISEPRLAARLQLADGARFDDLLPAHDVAWQQLWHRFHIAITNGTDAQRAVNFDLFHLLQTLSPHTAELDVGVPARGLHGEGYRGHIFWDEVFALPLLNLRLPELSRSLLRYRYRRLPLARALAADLGMRGALFPWQSGSDGREETPRALYNPLSGRWMPDNSRRQYHVNLAIAYNVWHHWEITGDLAFLSAYGAEMLIEIARFWASLAQYDAAGDRYDIRGVMGPDEFHDGYPERPGEGIDNSAYVNIMTAWVLARAIDAHRILGQRHGAALWERLGLSNEELTDWEHLSRRLRVPFLADGLIAQFERYDELAELDWTAYRERYGDTGRLDLIFEAEGDSPNRYRASKQADVLMLLYLFTADELTELMARLGYSFDPATIPATIDYYLERTAHGSTLSGVAHAWVLARANRRGSWGMLTDALNTDLGSTRDSTREGIHLGAMAGALDILQRCYTGLDTREGTLWLHPALPDELDELRFEIRYRNQWINLRVNHAELELRALPNAAPPIAVSVNDRTYQLAAGETLTVPLGGL